MLLRRDRSVTVKLITGTCSLLGRGAPIACQSRAQDIIISQRGRTVRIGVIAGLRVGEARDEHVAGDHGWGNPCPQSSLARFRTTVDSRVIIKETKPAIVLSISYQ